MKVENVLFDLDGTLIDTRRDKVKILKECTDLLKIPPIRREEYLKVHTELLRGRFLETRYEIFRRILESKGVENSGEKARALTKKYKTELLDDLQVLDDAYKVLDRLSDYYLGILSNGPAKTQHDKIKKLGLGKYFNAIVISGEVGVAKPDREIFLKIINSESANKTLFVGDSRFNDVQGARNVGIRSILVKGRSTEDYGPRGDWEVENLGEVSDLVSFLSIR